METQNSGSIPEVRGGHGWRAADGRGRTETVHDSPAPWIADHIRRFEETGGHPRPGMADLLLTTRGRKSGVLRRTALAYVRDGDAYVLTASNAGADRHPAWYLNLVATPEVTLQVGSETFPATARPATAAESARLWPTVTAATPSYAAYRGATAREIPLVLVTPAETGKG